MQKYRRSRIKDRADIPIPALDHLDIEALDFSGRRIYLASYGWTTEFRIQSSPGTDKLQYGMWAKHSNWMGTLADVCLHTHRELRVAEGNPSSAMQIYDDLSLDLVRRCVLAMEQYQEGVPHQGLHGELFYNEREDEYFRSYPSDRVVLPERSNATEFLPGWPDYPDSDKMFARDDESFTTLVASHLTLVIENDLSWNCKVFADTHGWEYQNRQWSFKARPLLFKWNDQRIHTVRSRIERRSNDLSMRGAADVAKGIADTIAYWRNNYPDTLPPGIFLHDQQPSSCANLGDASFDNAETSP